MKIQACHSLKASLLLVLLSLFLHTGTALSAPSDPSAQTAGSARTQQAQGSSAASSHSASSAVFKVTVERNFSETTVQLPSLCKNDRAQKFCNRLTNYFARRFERDLITEQSRAINFDDPVHLNIRREISHQKVFLFFLQNPSAPVTTLYALSFQYPAGKPEKRMVETFNFDNENETNLRFEQLFEDPAYAAMLLARYIEQSYPDEHSDLFRVLITVTEYAPRNFIVLRDGLRLFFAPGLIPSGQQNGKTLRVQSLKVPLQVLMPAKPLARWWPELIKADPADSNSKESTDRQGEAQKAKASRSAAAH